MSHINMLALLNQSPMYILELTYPGTWLELESQEVAFEVNSLITSLETALSDAVVSLNLFESARKVSNQSFPDPEEWQKDAERRKEIMDSIREKFNIDRFDSDKFDEIRFLTEIELKREKWNKGNLPQSYDRRIVFIHAKSFLFAMDRIQKFLTVLADFEKVPVEIGDIKKDFEDNFPDLRHVRNSSAHMEDRVRKLGPYNKKIDPKPISNSMIHSPNGGVMIHESLRGNNFGSTMADGHYGEVEVSFNSVEIAGKLIQKVIDAFDWKGPKSHYPR